MVAIFEGTPGRNSGARFIEVVEEMDCVRVRYKPPFSQLVFVPVQDGTVNAISDFGQMDWTNRQINVMFSFSPGSKKPISVEEDRQGTIGAQPIWKERAKLR